MDPAKRSTESPSRLPLLLGVAVLLAGIAAWDWWAHSGAEVEPAAAPPRSAASARNTPETGKAESADAPAETARGGAHALASLAMEDLHDTVRRPLFEKRRRPIEPPATPAQAPPVLLPKRQADPNALTLTGILLNEGRGAIALLRRNQTGQNVRLEQGDTVDGWTIERIEAGRVLLVAGEVRITLELFAKR